MPEGNLYFLSFPFLAFLILLPFPFPPSFLSLLASRGAAKDFLSETPLGIIRGKTGEGVFKQGGKEKKKKRED